MGEWNHGLFGCFDDFGTCIISWFVPCVTFGQNAEASGVTSCFLGALLMFVPLVNLICWVKIRGAIREKHNIEGSLFNDLMAICCCGLCALVQEAQQCKNSPAAAIARN